MSSHHTKSGSSGDWVSARLDTIHDAAFRIVQTERAAENVKRKASYSMLDSKLVAQQKQRLYKMFDQTIDTIWIRFIYLSQSKFMTGEYLAHANLIRVSAIALEVRQGVFDLLDLFGKIKVALGGTLVNIQSVEFVEKCLTRIYGLVHMQEKLLELASDIKIKIAGAKQLKETAGNKQSALDEVQKGPIEFSPFVEAPIILLEERLKQFSSLDRENLYSQVPGLRDLRSSLAILYPMHCDDTAVALSLADSLGESYLRLLRSAELKNDFLAPVLAAFHSARSIAWVLLRSDHQVDLTATAQPLSAKHQSSRQLNTQGSVRRIQTYPGSGTTSPVVSPRSTSPVNSSHSFQSQKSPSATNGSSVPILSVGVSSPSSSNSGPAPRLSPSEDEEEVVVSKGRPASIVTPSSTKSFTAASAAASFEPPLLSQIASSSAQIAAAEEWVEAMSGNSKYYYNTRTGRSSWTRPNAFTPTVSSSSSIYYASGATPTSASSTLTPTSTNTRSNPTASLLSTLVTTDEEEELLPPVLPLISATNAAKTGKSCAHADCTAIRFAGRPYCVAHLNN